MSKTLSALIFGAGLMLVQPAFAAPVGGAGPLPDHENAALVQTTQGILSNQYRGPQGLRTGGPGDAPTRFGGRGFGRPGFAGPRAGYGARYGYGPRYGRGYGRSYGYRSGWRGRNVGAGIALGTLGALAAGAAIANSQPVYADPAIPVDDQVAYCLQRFKTYKPETGTYTGYDGLQHPCP